MIVQKILITTENLTPLTWEEIQKLRETIRWFYEEHRINEENWSLIVTDVEV